MSQRAFEGGRRPYSHGMRPHMPALASRLSFQPRVSWLPSAGNLVYVSSAVNVMHTCAWASILCSLAWGLPPLVCAGHAVPAGGNQVARDDVGSSALQELVIGWRSSCLYLCL